MIGKSKNIRSAWLITAPGPNTSDFFDALAKMPNFDIEVFYCVTDNEKWHGSFRVSDGHNHRFLWNANPFQHRISVLHFNPGIVTALQSDAYDIVVVGGPTYLTAVLAMASRWLTKRPYAVWGERLNSSGSKFRWAVQAYTSYSLVRRANAVFTMGPRGKQSFRKIGVPPDRIQELPYCGDLRPYLAVKRGAQRGPYKRRRVVTLSRLIYGKRVDLVINAFTELAPEFPEWDLSVGGAGPLSEALQQSVPVELRHRVKFVGFVSKAEQPTFYESADLFVLASQEDGWGVVVPEAMASGLPVISTRGVESALDLLGEGGVTVVPINDASALRKTMSDFMANVSLCEKEGNRARTVAKRFDATVVAERAAQDLRRVMQCSE